MKAVTDNFNTVNLKKDTLIKKIIASILLTIILLVNVPLNVFAEEIENINNNEIPAGENESVIEEDAEEGESIIEEDTEIPVLQSVLNSEDTAFKIALRWGGTSNTQYNWNATKAEERVIKLTFYYQNEVIAKSYQPGDLVVTIPGIGNLNRYSTIEAFDIAADLYGSTELKRDWSYQYNVSTDTYTFYNNNVIEQGSTFNGSFEMLYKFNSRSCKNGYMQNLKAELTDGEQTAEAQELSINFTSLRDTFYIEKKAVSVVSADGLNKYVEQGKTVSDYGWVKYTIKFNSLTLNARGLNNRKMIDTLPAGCVVATNSNITNNQDGTKTFSAYDSHVLDNRGGEYSIIVGYPEEYVGQTITNTAYLFGTYLDEEEEVELASSSVNVTIEKIQNQVIGIIPTKTMSPDYVYTNAIQDDINFNAYVHATSTINQEDGDYTIAITDDYMEILTDAGYTKLSDDEYNFTQIRVPGRNFFSNANGYTIQNGNYQIKLYALYKEDIVEGDVSSRALENYTLVYDGIWVDSIYTHNLEKDAVAVRAELIGLSESIQSFYISASGTINISENLENETYINPTKIINYAFTELKDKDGNSLISEIIEADYTQDRIYDIDYETYGKGQCRTSDFISIRETPKNPSYYYARAIIDEFSIDDNLEYFITKLTHYLSIDNKDGKNINSIELYGIADKEELETIIDSLQFTYSDLKFKYLLPIDVNMQDYLLQKATITKQGDEIGINFNFSDNPIVSTHFTLGYTIDARLNYEDYYDSENPTYSIITYGCVNEENIYPQVVETYKNKMMAAARDSESILLALASHQELIKMVKTLYSGDFVQEDAVTPMNDIYTYKLKLRNGYNTLLNTEFIDILEHAELTQVDGEYPYQESEWFGTFENADTTYIEAAGHPAHVYYANSLNPSDTDWVLMENYENGIWTTTEGNEANVKAIKVEIDGEIVENSITYVDINMKAPTDTNLIDKKTYNTYQINCDAIDLYTGVQSTYLVNMPSNVIDVRLVEKEYRIVIIKSDEESGSLLAGAQFGIYDEGGNKVDVVRTNLLGVTTIKGLKAGTYTLVEEVVPDGYKEITSATLTINEDGTYSFIAETEVEKSFELNFHSVGGYGWSRNPDGTWQSENYGSPYTTATMQSEQFQLDYGGTLTFEWSASTKSKGYDIVYYTIKDATTGNTVLGGTSTQIGGTDYGTVYELLIYDTVIEELQPGNYFIEFVFNKISTSNSGCLDRGFVKNVKVQYDDKTTRQTEGSFELLNNIPTINLNVINERAKGSITVHNTDEYLSASGTEILFEGVVFDLFDIDENLIDTQTTNNLGNVVFDNLDWGKTYIIKARQEVEGYELAESKNVYLSRLDKDTIVNIKNIRKTGAVELIKQDPYDGTRIDGAKYELYAGENIFGKDGNLLHEKDTIIMTNLQTDSEGKIEINNLIWGEYYFKEKETVYGYELSEDRYFFVIEECNAGTLIEINVNEQRSKANIQLLIIDEDEDFLPGVEFTLYNNDSGEQLIKTDLETGEEIKYITNNVGQLNIEGVEWGNYYIQETNTPEGYERIDTKFSFSVNRDTFKNNSKTITIVKNEETEENITIIRKNRKRGKVTLTKYAYNNLGEETNNVLQSAIYELYLLDGTLIGEYITDEDGKITAENLDWGSYYFLEKQAPEGYSVSDKKISFVINSANIAIEQKYNAYNKLESGELKINKVINKEDIYHAHGNSTFLFKIVGKNADEEIITYYRPISFSLNDINNADINGNITKTLIISDADIYKYEITEEDNYRFDMKEITPVSSNSEVIGNIGVITLSAEQNKGEITFLNQKKTNSLLTDAKLMTNIAEEKYYIIGITAETKESSYVLGTQLTKDDFIFTLHYNNGQKENINLGSIDNVTFGGENTYMQRAIGDYMMEMEIIYQGRVYMAETTSRWIIPKNYFSLVTIDGKVLIGGLNPEYQYRQEIIIPSMYNGKKIVGIADDAFSFNDNITNVVIEEGITSIGIEAFYSCRGLTSIELPEGLISIDDYAFDYCSKLTSINIPEGVTTIGNGAFSKCTSLESIELQEGLKSIGGYSFQNCSSLISINIPDGVTSIGKYIFNGCSSLESIDLPEGLTNIGDSAFSECSKLTSIKIPEGVTTIDGSTFSNCSSLTSIELSEGLASIGNYAFKNCSSLISINIPEGVTRIGSDAFNGCSSLESIEIPEGVTLLTDYMFKGCTSLVSVELSEGLKYIGDSAFYGCSALTTINIPESVIEIYRYAFSRCTSLQYIDLPEGLTYIGQSVFGSCSNLTSIKIPDGVKHIENYTFSNCDKLTSIDLPDGLTSIGYGVFGYCKSLTTINYHGTPEQFSAITIGSSNNYFTNATVNYITD